MPDALGVHVNESCTVPAPEVAAKVIVRGLLAQVACGVVLTLIPTAAKAVTMMRLIETPTRICGRYRLIRDSN